MEQLDRTIIIIATAFSLLRIRRKNLFPSGQNDDEDSNHNIIEHLVPPPHAAEVSPKFLINSLFWMKPGVSTTKEEIVKKLIMLPSNPTGEIWAELELVLLRKLSSNQSSGSSQSGIFAPLLDLFNYPSPGLDHTSTKVLTFWKQALQLNFLALECKVNEAKNMWHNNRVEQGALVSNIVNLLVTLHECIIIVCNQAKAYEKDQGMSEFRGITDIWRTWLLDTLAHLLVHSSNLHTVPSIVHSIAEDVESALL